MLDPISARVCACDRCPRLVAWTREVARTKRRQFVEETYWGKPVPSFGALDARLLIVGLAPAAHGANRTGRMFTGDESGRWLYRALHRAGFATRAESTGKDDGLRLIDARITAVVRCAPPDNKPTLDEKAACLPYLVEELQKMPDLRAILALGGFAWSGTLEALAALGHAPKPKPRFGHAVTATVGPYALLGSYHPSQQNTFTGRLTEPMLDAIFTQAKLILS